MNPPRSIRRSSEHKTDRSGAAGRNPAEAGKSWFAWLISPRGRFAALVALGVAQTVLYAFVLRLSHRFVPGQGFSDRPILAVLMLLGAAFFLYLVSLALSVGRGNGERRRGEQELTSGKLMTLIVFFAVLFRAVLLGSNPIQEIDIYRYLWDGRVLAAGVNPYRFSPDDVERYGDSKAAPEALQRLAGLRKSSPALATLFSRIHFREVPTVYPPASQLIFAAAARLTPYEAPVAVHLLVMKSVLLVFDVATIFLVGLLLARTGLPVGWVLAYAWCPLVLKEFSNSGHLDAIAVSLTTLTVYLLLPSRNAQEHDEKVASRHNPKIPFRAGWRDLSAAWLRNFRKPGSRSARPPATRRDCRIVPGRELIRQSMAAVFWAAATLAKLYPVVLMPVFLRWWCRRLGVRAAIPLAVYVAVIAAVYLPLMPSTRSALDPPKVPARETSRFEPAVPVPHGPFEGMRAFLGRWEMNDLLFALVIENLKAPGPPDPLAREPAAPWFAVIPLKWRLEIENGLAHLVQHFGARAQDLNLPWMLSRVLTGGSFLLICGWLALRPWPGDGSRRLLEGVFLSLAWLWFLSPTQNPWYWTWALPFVAFAARSWLLVSGLALVYYLRFYLLYQFETQTIGPTTYVGTEFFDFVVVWFEHLPVFVLLAVEGLYRWRREQNNLYPTEK